MVTKLLIANRGEIAVRIARTAHKLDISTVGVAPQDDETGGHMRVVKERATLPGVGPRAYLDIAAILDVAKRTGADAIHPGYGFLSESTEFAKACAIAGITFVGPKAETLKVLGDKATTRNLAKTLGVPLLNGTMTPTGKSQARMFFQSLPAGSGMMIKAVAGGGGRGIRLVMREDELDQAYDRCRSEAQAAFGNGDVYVEQFLADARHIEVQIIGDAKGFVLALGERECTLQRRNQKLIEIAPAPGLDPYVRRRLLKYATAMAAALNYRGLGTFEFLVERGANEQKGQIAFIEANPRLQVEHTVTEEAYTCDLVAVQLKIARRATLSDLGLFARASAPPARMAMQLRINAETVRADGSILPATGRIASMSMPEGPGVRVDGHAQEGYEINPAFDTLLSKLIVHRPAGEYPDLLAAAGRALVDVEIDGIETNVELLAALLMDPDVISNRVSTRFIDTNIARLLGIFEAPTPIAETSAPIKCEPGPEMRAPEPEPEAEPTEQIAPVLIAEPTEPTSPAVADPVLDVAALAPIQPPVIEVTVVVPAEPEVAVLVQAETEAIIETPSDIALSTIEPITLAAAATVPAIEHHADDISVIVEDVADIEPSREHSTSDHVEESEDHSDFVEASDALETAPETPNATEYDSAASIVFDVVDTPMVEDAPIASSVPSMDEFEEASPPFIEDTLVPVTTPHESLAFAVADNAFTEFAWDDLAVFGDNMSSVPTPTMVETSETPATVSWFDTGAAQSFEGRRDGPVAMASTLSLQSVVSLVSVSAEPIAVSSPSIVAMAASSIPVEDVPVVVVTAPHVEAPVSTPVEATANLEPVAVPVIDADALRPIVVAPLVELLGVPTAPVVNEAPEAIAAPTMTAPIPEPVIVVAAPLPGSIVTVPVAVDDHVARGATIAVIESMKMEHIVEAPAAGRIAEIHVETRSVVAEGDSLVTLQPQAGDAVAAATDAEHDLDAVRADLAAVRDAHHFTDDANRPDAIAKRHKLGMRSARENVADLLDPGSFVEYGALAVAAQRNRRSLEDLRANTPADGLITGLGTVNGAHVADADKARVAVMAYDYTVLAGTQGMLNHKKSDRLLDVASKWRLPVVLFAEGGGGRPGDTDWLGVAGLDCTTFHRYAALSGDVPRVGIVAGRCFAGNAALLGCSDVVIATKNSSIGMGGPAMIEGGGLGVVAPDEVGPVSVQAPNGSIDIVVDDEAAAVTAAKQYLGYFQGPRAAGDAADQRLLRHAIPENRVRVYDIRTLIDTLCDEGSVLELRSAFAPGAVTALVRIEGRPFGLIANNPKHLGGAIDAPACDKLARFLQLCDAFGLPVLSLCDTPGFMVGVDSERTAMVRKTSRLFVTAASMRVPVFTVVLRKGYGLGAQAMAAGTFHAPFFTIAWPTAEFGAMGLEGAVRLGFKKELEAAPEDSRKALFDGMVAKSYERGKATNMASYLEIDAVIDPADTRRWIMRGLASVPANLPPRKAIVDTW